MRSNAILRTADCELRNSIQDCNPKSEIQNPKSNGFTLIEIVITLVVLSIAAIGVLSVFATGMRGSADPLLISQATQLVQGELDQVLGEKAVANGFASIAIGNPLACNSGMLAGFNCNRNIYYVNAGALNTPVVGPTNYKHITVTVTNAVIGNVTAETLITNY